MIDAHDESYGQFTEGIRLERLENCYTMYTGYQNHIRMNQDSVFPSEKLKRLSATIEIEIRLPENAAHSSRLELVRK